jgi:hypothetical protein
MDHLFHLLSADELLFDHDDLRGERDEFAAGFFADDPELLAYEDTMELGRCLSGAGFDW